MYKWGNQLATITVQLQYYPNRLTIRRTEKLEPTLVFFVHLFIMFLLDTQSIINTPATKFDTFLMQCKAYVINSILRNQNTTWAVLTEHAKIWVVPKNNLSIEIQKYDSVYFWHDRSTSWGDDTKLKMMNFLCNPIALKVYITVRQSLSGS